MVAAAVQQATTAVGNQQQIKSTAAAPELAVTGTVAAVVLPTMLTVEYQQHIESTIESTLELTTADTRLPVTNAVVVTVYQQIKSTPVPGNLGDHRRNHSTSNLHCQIPPLPPIVTDTRFVKLLHRSQIPTGCFSFICGSTDDISLSWMSFRWRAERLLIELSRLRKLPFLSFK
jgi:hypothetical protein